MISTRKVKFKDQCTTCVYNTCEYCHDDNLCRIYKYHQHCVCHIMVPSSEESCKYYISVDNKPVEVPVEPKKRGRKKKNA